MTRKVKPVILGIQGTHLTEQEKELLSKEHILGFILFRRNIESIIERNEKGEVIKVIQNKDQLLNLIEELKITCGEEIIISLDQEGGRVRRLTTPTFKMRPAAKTFGDTAEEKGIDIAYPICKENYKDLAKELKSIGFNVNFAPVVDLKQEGAHDVIGDRSFGSDIETVIALSKAAIEGMKEEGITSTIKHIPGHGRSIQDSHKELPHVDEPLEVLEKTDFAVFKELAKETKIAMTAHIKYKALDEDNAVTLSKKAINYIREKIGFKGILVTDAIEMEALSENTISERAKKALEAGCDVVLECTGKIENMAEVLNAVGEVETTIFDTLFA